MLEKLKLSKSGYYACLKRGPSKTKIRRERITKEVKRIPKESFEIYGSPKITSESGWKSKSEIHTSNYERK